MRGVVFEGLFFAKIIYLWESVYNDLEVIDSDSNFIVYKETKRRVMFRSNKSIFLVTIGIFLLFIFGAYAAAPTAQNNDHAVPADIAVTEEQAITIAKKVAAKADAKLDLEAMEFHAKFISDSVKPLAAEQSKPDGGGYWDIAYYPKGKKIETFEDNWEIKIIHVNAQSGDARGPLSIQ